jgi:hypothetical protein
MRGIWSAGFSEIKLGEQMDDQTRINNRKKAVELLLPHAEALLHQRETDARDKYTVKQSAEFIQRDIESAKAFAELP